MPFVLGDPTQTSPEIHVGDVGTQFIVTIYNQEEQVQNISSSTSLLINFLPPSRTGFSKEASLYTNGTDGKLLYVLQEGDIDEAGEWSYQCVLQFPSGAWRTNIEKFTVYPNIEVATP